MDGKNSRDLIHDIIVATSASVLATLINKVLDSIVQLFN